MKKYLNLQTKVFLSPSAHHGLVPFLVVKKKDGTNCIVIDYCKLNSITKKDSYPLPLNDDTLDRLGGAQFYSAICLVLGYWQIDLPEEDQVKYAIFTSSGIYQPTRMPQGLCNAPTTF